MTDETLAVDQFGVSGEEHMDISTFAGLCIGITTGTVGTTLGILNYLRDRPRIAVSLQFGMRVLPGGGDTEYALLSVTNIGRRPIFLSHAHLVSAEGAVIVRETVSGMKLTEGDPPKVIPFTHADVAPTFKNLVNVRAVIQDSAGTLYCSWLERERQNRFGKFQYWWNCRRSRLYRKAQSQPSN